MNELILTIIISNVILLAAIVLIISKKQSDYQKDFFKNTNEQQQSIQKTLLESTNQQHLSLSSSLAQLNSQVHDALFQTRQSLESRLEQISVNTDKKLLDMSKEVDNRLKAGFDKTADTFTDIVKRLALIDDAQKKITELSTNVVSLQEILSDKRARGAFGEVQLAVLLKDALPDKYVLLQHVLSNQTRVDCLLQLPEPTGAIAIDSKFPLENYQQAVNWDTHESERQKARARFKQDIKKHIEDIHSKYILPPETTDSAIMFIPSEAVFSEIHSHFPELVELSQKKRVWLTSPSTMMAIVSTASTVIKDLQTRKQVHLIQEHLQYLSKDFMRFEKRMSSLAKHVQQVHQDVDEIQTSANKISSRFVKIERVELDSAPMALSHDSQEGV